MDKLAILKPVIDKYPTLNITQLGVTVLYIAAIRAGMGHENARSTISDYIHKEGLSEGVADCVDFLEREILALKKSKVDIDVWKIGNMRCDKPE